jgi:hypothetical protein
MIQIIKEIYLWKSVHVITAVVHLPVVLHQIAQLVVVAQSVQGLPERSLKVVKSAIHAGFGPLPKNETNHVFAPEFLNPIFQKMSPVKS